VRLSQAVSQSVPPWKPPCLCEAVGNVAFLPPCVARRWVVGVALLYADASCLVCVCCCCSNPTQSKLTLGRLETVRPTLPCSSSKSVKAERSWEQKAGRHTDRFQAPEMKMNCDGNGDVENGMLDSGYPRLDVMADVIESRCTIEIRWANLRKITGSSQYTFEPFDKGN
jgi:hypothetical protein